MAVSKFQWRFGALVLAAVAISAGQTGAGWAESGLEKLEIDTAGGPRILQVEVMHSEQERERGLMFRKYLPKDRGMLFDFPVEEPIMMWMKNTYIPLDMVFMDHDGRVVGIARNAEPLSETIIPSGAPAAGVLEINGGEADTLGIKTGDVVHHAMFKN
jgi:uncharacterized membrane protein (UPF0127 family)